MTAKASWNFNSALRTTRRSSVWRRDRKAAEEWLGAPGEIGTKTRPRLKDFSPASEFRADLDYETLDSLPSGWQRTSRGVIHRAIELGHKFTVINSALAPGQFFRLAK
jgi:hypothetical protein